MKGFAEEYLFTKPCSIGLQIIKVLYVPIGLRNKSAEVLEEGRRKEWGCSGLSCVLMQNLFFVTKVNFE